MSVTVYVAGVTDSLYCYSWRQPYKNLSSIVRQNNNPKQTSLLVKPEAATICTT